MDQYLKEIAKIPLLTEQEERALGLLARAGDEVAIQKLATHNVRLVVSIAKKYQNKGIALEDLIGEGNLGLMDAIKRFDPDKGRFSTGATDWIKKAIRDAFKQRKQSYAQKEDNSGDVGDDYYQLTDDDPGGVEHGYVIVASPDAAATSSAHFATMDTPARATAFERDQLARLSSSQDHDDDVNEAGDKEREQDAAATHALSALSERDAKILRLFFGIDTYRHSRKEIAAEVNLTPQRVGQILRKLPNLEYFKRRGP